MSYARPLTDDEFAIIELEYITDAVSMFNRMHVSRNFKRENYGMLADRPVKIDYEL
jgi:hypothetical protein